MDQQLTPDALWRLMKSKSALLARAKYPAIEKYDSAWSYLSSRVVYNIEKDIPRIYNVCLLLHTAAMEWLEENQPQ